MQKIKTREEIEKTRVRNSRIATIVMLGLLVVSTLGYAFLSGTGSNSSSPASNPAQNQNGFYNLNIGGQQFSFRNSPESAKVVPVNISMTLSDYNKKPLFVVSDSDLIDSEITSTLGQYTERMQKACYGKCELDLPEKSCLDNLIVVNSSAPRGVYQNQSCIFVNGDMLSVDAFLYKLFGVN